MSLEIVSGGIPCCIAGSHTVKSKLPPPWPTSMITPRCLAARAAGQQLAVLHGVVAGAAVGVREDVARPQQVEQIGQIPGRRADVTHHAHALARHLGGADARAAAAPAPFCPTTESVIRTFTPSTTSGFSATTLAQPSTLA